MKKATKLTVEDLIAKKQQRELQQAGFKQVYIESLGGELEIEKLPVPKYLGLLGDVDEDSSALENVQAQVSLIYESCPLLHNKALQEAYECVEPTDIVYKVLDDNLMEIARITGIISEFYGSNADDLLDTIKNS